jgi:hypothetical protein
MSPGSRSSTVVSGTRESEQPIHKIWGLWPFAILGNNWGSCSACLAAHARLRSRSVDMGDSAVNWRKLCGVIWPVISESVVCRLNEFRELKDRRKIVCVKNASRERRDSVCPLKATAGNPVLELGQSVYFL